MIEISELTEEDKGRRISYSNLTFTDCGVLLDWDGPEIEVRLDSIGHVGVEPSKVSFYPQS